jgi:uncharacterized protein DUF4328
MLKNNSERGKNIIIAFWFLFAISFISTISTYFEYELLAKARTGNVSLSEATANDTRQRIIGLAEILMRIVVVVLFIMWLRRAYYNIRRLGFNTRYTDGWAAGAWFVPIMNLYAPYQIVKEVWDNTQFKAQQNSTNPTHKTSTIIGVWWFLWIVSSIIGNFYVRLAFNSNRSLEDSISLDKSDIIIGALDLISMFLIIEIIQKIRKFESEMNDAILIETIASEEQPVVESPQ